MLELNSLGEWLEKRLNETMEKYLSDNTTTLLKTNRYSYKFKVYTDIGEHKGYDYVDAKGNISLEKTNQIVRYIEANLTQTDSAVESTNFVNIVRNTELSILIPLNDIELLEKQNKVIEEIRNVIEETFLKNGTGVFVGNDGAYQFSFEYSLTSTGERTTRAFVGDSAILTAYINFYYVESGMQSSFIRLYIDGEQIIPIRMGISRGITQQTNTYSNDTRAVAMNTPTSSLFNINFDVVARTTGFYYELYIYAITGKNTDENGVLKSNVAHLVEIAMAIVLDDDSLQDKKTYKLMNFENVGISTQVPLIASMSVVMTETKYQEGLTNLSKYASDNLSLILAEQE